MRTRSMLPTRRRAYRTAAALAAIAATAILVGCGIARIFHSTPKPPRFGPDKLSLYELQSAVRDVADETTDLIADAAQRVINSGVSPEGRRMANQIRLEFGLNATINASAPNPLVALIDLCVMTRLSRVAMETHPIVAMGPHAEIAANAMRDAEVRVWDLAARALTPQQLKDVNDAIARWKAENFTWSYVTGVRLADFAELRLIAPGRTQPSDLPPSLLDILAIDPLAGLDPATREIEQSRMLAERAMFQLQRAPRLIRWEVESLYDTVMATPEAISSLAALDRISNSSKDLVDRIGNLPAQLRAGQSSLLVELRAAVDEERADMIRSIEELIAKERESIRADLSDLEGPLSTSLEQVRKTTDGLTTLTQELNKLVTSSDALAARLRLGEEPPKPRAQDANPRTFADATTDLAATAHDLRASIDTINELIERGALTQGSEDARRIIDDAQTTASRLANLLFWRGAALIGLFGVVLFLVLAGVRRIPRSTT